MLFDAVVVPDGADAVGRLAADGRVLEFLKDQYRHCKPMLVLGCGTRRCSTKAGIPQTLPSGEPDPGLIARAPARTARSRDALHQRAGQHRHFDRETDPPRV